MSGMKAKMTNEDGSFKTDAQLMDEDMAYKVWADKYDKITRLTQEKENDNVRTKDRK